MFFRKYKKLKFTKKIKNVTSILEFIVISGVKVSNSFQPKCNNYEAMAEAIIAPTLLSSTYSLVL